MTRAFIVVASTLSVLGASRSALEALDEDFGRSAAAPRPDPIDEDSGTADEPPLAGNDAAAAHPRVSDLR